MSAAAFPKPVHAPPAPPKRLARKTRPARRRKTTLGALKRRLWRLVAAYVRERDNHTCVTCGARADQAGHFYSCAIASTWVDPKNLGAQCSRCNLFLHGNPGPFADYILSTYGPAEMQRLTRRASQACKQWKAPEIRALIAAFKAGGGAAFEAAYYEENL